jgi:hypothetical protein
MMLELPSKVRRWVRPVALLGVVVCGAWTITDLSLGLYKEAFAFAICTAANVWTYYQNRRS